MFKKVNPRQNFPEMEKNILEFWKKNKIFEKSIDNKNNQKIYSFFDGPPFATGLPHYGHIVASLMKDVVPRYWTMRGYKVERRWGWDCHGLPIENLVEKEHKIKNKREIERLGIDKFNKACRDSVLRYADDWKKFIPRIGRWVDMENDYRTMDWKYTESIWRVFSELYKKGLVYEGYKSMHICPRCETTLSNFEVTQGYKDITDLSATVKFKLKYPAGKTGRGVGAMVLNDKNEILLLRRNEDGRRKTWAMPGGKVDKDETFMEALKREVMEELGVEIELAEPFSAKPDILEGRLFETVCYKVGIKGNPTIMEKNKIDKLEWFPLDDLPEIDYPPSRDAIKVYKQNKKVFHFDIDVSKPLSLVYVLAWTTTPWTLPGNVALAVGEDIKYIMVKMENDFYVLAKDRVEEVLKDKKYEVLDEVNEKDLAGLKYEPLFDYYSKIPSLTPSKRGLGIENKNNAYKIYAGDFVTTEEGTGIVHIAPAFGDDDMKLAEKYKLPLIRHVGMDGRFKEEVVDFREGSTHPIRFANYPSQEGNQNQEGNKNSGDNDSNLGREVKPKRNPRETDEKIVEWLEENDKLFSKENYKHSYPHCWRCDTPLLNYATSSWFVKVTAIKDKMIKNNQEISWMPEYIKDGRFGKWLENARDWAISRSRFWGAPLPIWRCEKCKNIEVINSIDDLRNKTDEKITKFILLRHGESESNVLDVKAGGSNKYGLTEKGIKQCKAAAKDLKNQKIDLIITSPIKRARQTAEIINKELNLEIIEDGLVKEYDFGKWNECSHKDLIGKSNLYNKYSKLDYGKERYNFAFGGDGESRQDVENRVRKFINKYVQKYPKKNILVITHGGINAMFNRIINEYSIEKTFKTEPLFGNAEQSVFYVDEKGEKFDLHKPNIDKVKIKCPKCGGEAKIVGDVFDCWFESGSMPYAQWHYPFENRDKFEKSFPADFIAEGIDQTRGWFYTLIVLSTALFDKPAFKNVIVNGVVLAKNGQKMSKRLKNYPDPNIIVEKYGADALRYYLLTSPVMKAENLNFSEKGVEEVLKKFILTLWNVYSFLVMNTTPLITKNPPAPLIRGEFVSPLDKGSLGKRESKNSPSDKGGVGGVLLDKWILSEFNILVEEVNNQMRDYDLAKAARPLREFVDKLSNWFIRRSRKRFTSDDTKDRDFAFQTLRYILIEYSKLLAPFMPFMAEEIYQNLTDNKESVHLEDYPVADKNLIDEKISSEMNFVRNVVALGLAARAKNGLKVRQPLSELRIVKNEDIGYWILDIEDELMNLIKDELNVKEVKFVESLQEGSTAWSLSRTMIREDNGANDVEKDNWICEDDGKIKIALNAEITDKLKLEGFARELVRHIQVMRKEAKYNRDDVILVKYSFIGDGDYIKKVFDKWGGYIKKECLVKNIGVSDELAKGEFDLVKELKLGNWILDIGIKK